MEPIPLIPKEIPYARHLDADILPVYDAAVAKFSGKARDVLAGVFSRAGDGMLAGGSTFSRVLLETLLPAGTHSATRADLELALVQVPSLLQGAYSDVGVALHSVKGPNAPDAKRLAEQLRQREILLGSGKLIPFSALKLTPDAKAESGLALDLKPEGVAGITNLDSYKWDYAGSRGLARAFLGGGSGWYSDGVGLAYSGSDGRVVVVSAGGAA